MEKYFFEVPIYRCNPDEFKKEINELRNRITKELNSAKKYNSEKDFKELVNYIYGQKSCIYDFNEITGWLKLYILGSQIRGRYFFESNLITGCQKKRINKAPRKRIFNTSFNDSFQVDIKKEENSTEIFNKLLDKLSLLNERNFNKRYFDLEKLKNVGSYVNWKQLVIDLNEFNHPSFSSKSTSKTK